MDYFRSYLFSIYKMVLLDISSSRRESNSISSTNFSVKTGTSANFSKINLIGVRIPNVIYNITNSNNSFVFNGNTISIPVGAYSLSNLLTELQTLTSLTVTSNSQTNQLIFTGTKATFTLAFTTSNNAAYVLGFVSGETYNSNSSFILTSPYSFDLSFDNLFIRITNLPMPNYCSKDMNFSFFVPMYQNSNRIIFLHTTGEPQQIDFGNEYSFYQLQVELRDRNNNFAYLSNLDWSFQIELI